MSRWIFVLLSAVFLSGCALLLPEQKELPPAQPEVEAQHPEAEAQQQEFDRYLDDFLAGGDSTVLDQYLAGIPDSKQREALQRFFHELQQCRADLADRTAERDAKNQLVADLEDKNHLLRETIEQLKSLLIQLEQRVH